MPFLGALALLLIALKLIGIISISWWIVTAPLWGIPVFFLVSFVVLFLGFFGIEIVKEVRK